MNTRHTLLLGLTAIGFVVALPAQANFDGHDDFRGAGWLQVSHDDRRDDRSNAAQPGQRRPHDEREGYGYGYERRRQQDQAQQYPQRQPAARDERDHRERRDR
jgi:hypothetical protein